MQKKGGVMSGGWQHQLRDGVLLIVKHTTRLLFRGLVICFLGPAHPGSVGGGSGRPSFLRTSVALGRFRLRKLGFWGPEASLSNLLRYGGVAA